MSMGESNYLLKSASNAVRGPPITSLKNSGSANSQNSHRNRSVTIFLSALLALFFGAVSCYVVSYSHIQQQRKEIITQQQSGELSGVTKMNLSILSKSNKKSKKKKDDDNDDLIEECLKNHKYSKTTAKALYEMPFSALFGDSKGESVFEASGIAKRMDDPFFYAVFDSSWDISKIAPNLPSFSSENILIKGPKRNTDEDSGFESIFEFNNTFYITRESVQHGDCDDSKTDTTCTYHAIIEEISLIGNNYEVNAQCKTELQFDGKSKGLEGSAGFLGTNGDFFILGLCEGNHCSGKKHVKEDKGNGMVVLMAKRDCLWRTIKTIPIPHSAFFTDYADLSIRPDGRVAIVSQEDSAVWIGKLKGVQDGKLDPDSVQFDHEMGQVFHFPKSNMCQTIYCNVEGVTFINDNTIMVVSDRMKGGGDQPFYCLEKDQSIHAFLLP